MSAAVWKKSSRSNESGDACVEVASIGELVAVRDSKDPNGSVLAMSRQEFRCFARVLKDL
ncbi:DUF397 domain-containing protein [Actinomadura latina]|nr:DUF397 domain-containing protein [Actinomadura latina]